MSRNPTWPTLVLSSRNRKKSQEIAEILAPHGVLLQPVADFPQVGEVVEDADSFIGNAEKKAREPALLLGRWVIGEDSGLCVDALNGGPGIYSARFSGPAASDDSNNQKLIHELANVADELRTAAYTCTIALADPTGNIRLRAVGRCRGRILREPRGVGGFGYDPYFLVPEFHRSFGELSSRLKHQISHRAKAFAAFVPELLSLFRKEFPG